ncbi:replicative DNA helicase [candidate division KSB1 bacterium]
MNTKMQETEQIRERIPPQAVEIEMAVIGAMMLEKEAVYRTLEIIPKPHYFYKTAHQRIYDAMIQLNTKDQAIDLITVTEKLRQEEKLEEVGGSYYLTECINQVTSSANVEYHARIVLEKALLRSMISIASEITESGYEAQEDAIALLDSAERKIFGLSQHRLRHGFQPIGTIMHETIDILDKYQSRQGDVIGVPTGFKRLDELTAGFQKSDLIIIAGRPSMGKTAFSLSCALNACKKAGSGVGFFSLEMSKSQLCMRLLSLQSHLNLRKIRIGKLNKKDMNTVVMAAGTISEMPIFIDDTASLSIFEMRAKARRLKTEYDVGIIIVDYLQLMQGSARIDSRQQEISEISRSLKALAKELEVPVVALSQLSRAPETRGGSRRPMLSDLRESGAIEQDADLVLFIYRPEMYGESVDDDGRPTENVAEIIIGKQRNGPTDTVPLAFIKESARFEDMAFEEEFA